MLGAWLVVLHVRMIASPAPQEMREGAMVWITRLLLEGRNPYALSELPASTEVYGILYHIVVLPFAALFGNGFQVHRAVSGLAIGGACLILYRLLRREGADPLPSFVGLLLFYMSSLYFVAPLARPDGLGLFLSMLGISLVFKRDVSAFAFAAGVCVALLALLTKSYLAYPPFIAAAYRFLFVSRVRGLLEGLVATTAAVAVLLAVALMCPAYVNVSFLVNAGNASYNVDHLRHQTWDWLVFSLPLVLATATTVVRSTIGVRFGMVDRRRPNIFAFAALVNAGVFCLWLGGHPGAHMTYLFQLVTPSLTLAVVPRISRTGDRAIFALAMLLAFWLNAHYFPLSFARFTHAERTFASLEAAIAPPQAVLASTELAGPLALSGRPVFDTGHSEYFAEGSVDRWLPGVESAAAIRARWEAFNSELRGHIASRDFDLIVRSRRHGLIPPALVEQHYEKTRTVDVDFAWTGQRWPLDFWRR